MSTERARRKLSAILSADVKGYSRLMGEDEVGTVRTLKNYRELVSQVICEYRGRVVDSPGDNLLAEFASVVDAVESAIEIQRQLKAKNAQLPEKRRMEFRIGINLGDVIEEGERIYGDGVNVAARLEGLALPGGVCVSGTAYDQVENKVAAEFEYLGEQAVKNIRKPVRAYRVRMEKGLFNTAIKQEVALHAKPSIAVLPFVNMSGDPEQEYFSDGMTEDLITDLSKSSGLLVIARNSTFIYKGKPVKVQEVGQELGVRFVLEGSVRKAGNRIRISAQLVDAITGGHLWAERYDRELKDIFDLQDEVTQKIITALAVNLTDLEIDRLARHGTDNLKAYDYALRGQESYHRFTKEANVEAQEMLEKSIQLDPRYASAYSWLGMVLLHRWTHGWSQDPRLTDRAFESAQRALGLDDSTPEAHRILGDVYLYRKEHDKAVAELKKAIALNPNYADAFAGLAEVFNWTGRPEKALELIKKGMRLNPHHHAWYLYVLGTTYIAMHLDEEAIDALKRGIIRNPEFLGNHLALAPLYAEMGRMEEAQHELKEILRVSPNFSIEMLRGMIPSKDIAIVERAIEAFRKAGLK
jgi:adenylate cyclase